MDHYEFENSWELFFKLSDWHKNSFIEALMNFDFFDLPYLKKLIVQSTWKFLVIDVSSYGIM